MATTTSITTTYAGEFAGKYIAAALLSAPTLEKGGITIHPNVKYKQVIQKVALDDIVKNASCDFDATSTLTLTERVLQPEEFQVNLSLCRKDFHSTWQAAEMGYSAFDQLPKSFSDYLIAYVSEKVASAMETTIWTGVNATAGQFDGISTQIAADAALPAAQEVTGTTVTASNVIVELGKLVDAIPARMYGQEDLTLYVSQNVAQAYIRALGGFAATIGANGVDNKGTQWYNGGALSFEGINIFVAKGLASNKMILAQKSNLYFGTGILNDQNEVKVIDMSDIDGSQNVRVVMRFTAGVQHVFGSDIVFYS